MGLIFSKEPATCAAALMRLIAADGIHLTMPGYERLFDTLADWLRVRV